MNATELLEAELSLHPGLERLYRVSRRTDIWHYGTIQLFLLSRHGVRDEFKNGDFAFSIRARDAQQSLWCLEVHMHGIDAYHAYLDSFPQLLLRERHLIDTACYQVAGEIEFTTSQIHAA